MSGAGIIIGKKSCCCPRGCNLLDVRSWLTPPDKYLELAASCSMSGNWWREPIPPSTGSASWNASISGSDAYRGPFIDPWTGCPQWASPGNQIIGSGSHPSIYGVLSASLRVAAEGQSNPGLQTDWNAVQAAVPPCDGQAPASPFIGYACFISVAYFSSDPAEAGFPWVGMGPAQDTTGFGVTYYKRCCNYQDGPLGTYYRLGPATITSGPNQVSYIGGYSGFTHTTFFTRSASDTLTVTETPS